ncbi:MAG: threonine--tRNA ligase [Clostridia bacterium]
MAKVTLKDKSVREVPNGMTPLEVALEISQGLARVCMACEIDGELKDLTTPIMKDCTLNLLKFEDEGGKEAYRHTASHIMAQAVKRLYPEARLAIGPSIENGFYYDFDIESTFSEEDFPRIEGEMKKIIEADYPIQRFTLSREEALKKVEENGEAYKAELIRDLDADAEISFYTQGEFTDLCAGPHLPSTGKMGAYKLLKVSGAYWRGDEKNKMLQRIYGTAYPKQKELDEYIARLQEAEKRDHRKLGKELELFTISESIGPGLVLWLPKGGRIRTLIEDFWKKEHFANGYDVVYSPHVGKAELWETSGHLGFYKENMYSSMSVEDVDYYIKPMNCPFHIEMYKNRQYSYRDLPLRWAELGTVYRYEKSGVLHGLLRVRGFTQDDAHIFCSKDQMPGEIIRVLRFCLHLLESFGFTKFKLYLATKPKEKSVGETGMWDAATKALEKAIQNEGLEYEMDEGGGAFYGPKIDIKIKDALDREWQCSTIQFDFNLPERFDLYFINSAGEKERPYTIHRALFGSIERFFGILVEQYAGAFPTWLAPVQARILTISQAVSGYACEVRDMLAAKGIRVEVDDRNEKIGYKIREARNERIPFILTVGEKEAESRTLSVRSTREGELGTMDAAAFQEKILQEDRERIQ